LNADQPTPEFQGQIWIFHPGGDAEMQQRVKNLGAEQFESKLFPQGDFARMLAKIAHAYAAAHNELASFAPLLPDMILGRYETPSYLVGCLSDQLPDPEPFVRHRINTQIGVVSQRGVVLERFLLARIRLFASLGTPEYHVVIGRTPIPNAVSTGLQYP
jgi:hypothetical protein